MKKIVISILCLVMAYSFGWASGVNYYGSVAVNSPAELGNIDLAFHIETNDSTGVMNPEMSYIILEKTILFPKTGQLPDGTPVGPMVQSGILNETTFHLETSSFSGTVSGKTITRKLTLNGTPDPTQPNMIVGSYTEVISGFLRNNLTVTGDFIIARPLSQAPESLTLDLHGVILALQVCAGFNKPVSKDADINGDGKIGIAEAIYALQKVAGTRQ